MDAQILISDTNYLLNRIEKIKKEHYDKRKAGKKNFNFFSAIVSGKYDKQHIEKYHSNFISYLLNPKASHDFGTLFLKQFFEILKKAPFNIGNLPDEETLTLERERPTDKGRFIDISLEYKNDWIIFIENKIWSGEQEDQITDYYDFAKRCFSHRMGIYLTLRGEEPTSIDVGSFSDDRIICLSYKTIIEWLKCCSQIDEVVKHQHVQNALRQYIETIETILNVMKEDTKEIIEFLKKDKVKTINIIKNQRILNDAIKNLVIEVRDKFLGDLKNEVGLKRGNENTIHESLKVEIVQGNYFFSGDEEKCFGLGFIITENNERFDYGSEESGGCGNGIQINNINAFCGDGIDQANAMLVNAYETAEWNKIVNLAADKIISEVINKVLPKFGIY